MAGHNHHNPRAVNLPDGWAWTTLEEIADLLRGVSYKKDAAADHPQGGYLPILRATNIQDDHLVLDNELVYVPQGYAKPEQILKPGDVVICMSSGSKHLVGKTAQLLHEWQGSFGAFCSVVRFDSNIDQRFVGFFFSSPGYRNLIQEKSSGVNINNLRHGDIESLSVPVPPLAEQQRIVAKIEELFTRLDAGVAALKRAQANLRRYKAAVLKAACEGKLVAQDPNDEPASKLLERILAERRTKWEADLRAKGKDPKKAKYVEPKSPDVDGLPKLPEGWCWARFEDLLVELKNGHFSKAPSSEPPGIPILRISAVRPMYVSLESPRYLNEEWGQVSHYQLNDGDLLFTRYNGTLELVGVCGVVRGLNRTMIYPDKLIRARVVTDSVLPEYLEVYFATEVPRRLIENKAKSTAGQQGISGADLKGLPVAVSPLAEQHRIVAEVERRLSVVQEMEAALAANLARSERLRQSILKRAFEGRLVPQDPSDEPASALLERIHRQQAESSQSDSGRRPSHAKAGSARVLSPLRTSRKAIPKR